MTDKIRVALPLMGSNSWIGGLSYQSNLIEAIRQYAPQIEVCLLGPSTSSLAIATDDRVVQYPWPRHRLIVRIINRVMRRIFGYDILGLRTLRAVQADVVFPSNPYWGGRIPALYWIADFQHIHLPEMFSDAEIRVRNRVSRRGAKCATLVVLSSQDALRDFRQFLPQYSYKGRVMSFVVYVSPAIYDVDPAAVVIKYNIPERFFYLPNQFWKHKNHITVLEALNRLRSRGIFPFIACTGNPFDYRHPTFFTDLTQKVSQWGLSGQIRFLGIVPKAHVHLLIRQSTCVLNPSLFEGWSTTVEEAKSIGKRVLLSDLAVHREQNPPKATYFDPHNPEDLAHKMAEVWADGSFGPDLELESKARRELPERMRSYANAFESIAREAIAVARGH